MSFQDELNRVTKTPEDVLSKREKESYAKGVDSAQRSYEKIKEEFDAKMEKYHMEKAEVKPQSSATTKKFEKQFLKTDTGIEINIPMEQYQDINQVEFISNPDGTISVMIKNINKISTR